jgi:hypothetical protein
MALCRSRIGAAMMLLPPEKKDREILDFQKPIGHPPRRDFDAQLRSEILSWSFGDWISEFE